MAFIYTRIHRNVARAPSTAHTHTRVLHAPSGAERTHTHINFGVFIFMYSYVLLSAATLAWRVGGRFGGGSELAAFVHNAKVRARISGWTDFSATGVTTGRTHARSHALTGNKTNTQKNAHAHTHNTLKHRAREIK